MGRSLDSVSSASSYSPGPDSPSGGPAAAGGGGGKSPQGQAPAYSPGLFAATSAASSVFSSPGGARGDSPRGGLGGGNYSPASDLSSSAGLFSPGPLAAELSSNSSHFSGLIGSGSPWGPPSLSGRSELFNPFSEPPCVADMSAAAASYAAALSGLVSGEGGVGGSPLSLFPGLTATHPLTTSASQQYLWSLYLDKPKSAL
jgi:hypothetical protein